MFALKQQSHLLKSKADAVISEVVGETQADLLVMGAMGRARIAWFFIDKEVCHYESQG